MVDDRPSRVPPQTLPPDVEKPRHSEDDVHAREDSQEQFANVESKEFGGTASPLGSDSGAAALNEAPEEPAPKDDSQPEKGNRSKARVALIMFALMVCLSDFFFYYYYFE